MGLAEEKEDSAVNSPLPPPFLEVKCKSLNKTSRFAAGTKSGFAVSLINRKIEIGSPLVSHIEAFNDGEEPISFGPDAALVDYGNGWKLQTVTELDFDGVKRAEHVPMNPTQIHIHNVQSSDGTHPPKTLLKPRISSLYIAKIFLAFILIFVLGASFTLALDNLPKLILFINSFM
ncbi:hypothetical protein JCGZ_02668 [Jatropha curcas]|uniref:Uncharacterized protein n=1 Tax=Jatropha curcas TaxID=180498 RepID=A0A067KXE7_JATCU|nr:uncharacterized protein LOC119369290 [Jatropha curcas]XP_037492542.1 uncharacterized protein LOC105632577 [Jatropha curcas]KDP39648.1 hypothetical protein JCGZ_02668 [Jatropha curcas]